ncbi:MAG: alpha/beta fold hydrolase [Deltaproteobacteria bacterium]
MANQLVFIHGLESTAQGTKGQFFRLFSPEMIIEDYTGDFDTRMVKLRGLLANIADLILVGSSYGGLMAAQYSIENEDRVKKIILLAPALHLQEFSPPAHKKSQIPVIIYHGIGDDIVDPYKVKTIAQKYFSNLEHHFVDDDHPLRKTFPLINWKELLRGD